MTTLNYREKQVISIGTTNFMFDPNQMELSYIPTDNQVDHVDSVVLKAYYIAKNLLAWTSTPLPNRGAVQGHYKYYGEIVIEKPKKIGNFFAFSTTIEKVSLATWSGRNWCKSLTMRRADMDLWEHVKLLALRALNMQKIPKYNVVVRDLPVHIVSGIMGTGIYRSPLGDYLQITRPNGKIDLVKVGKPYHVRRANRRTIECFVDLFNNAQKEYSAQVLNSGYHVLVERRRHSE